MAISDEMLGQFGRLEPAEPKRITRSIPIGDNMVRDQTSMDGGMTWTSLGEPYSRFKPDRETGESFTGESFSRFNEDDRRLIIKMLRTAPAELKDTVSKLFAAGTPVKEIYNFVRKALMSPGGSGEALMSPAEGQFGGSPHGEGPFWRQYNQGGIVSLRHLTRPLGI